jgi:hypothetical protein
LGEGESAVVGQALDERLDAPLRVVGRTLGRAVEEDVELDLEAAHVVFEPRELLVHGRLRVARDDGALLPLLRLPRKLVSTFSQRFYLSPQVGAGPSPGAPSSL